MLKLVNYFPHENRIHSIKFSIKLNQIANLRLLNKDQLLGYLIEEISSLILAHKT